MTLLFRKQIAAVDIVLLRSRWGWLLTVGLVLVLIGVLALVNVTLTTILSVLSIGVMMTIGGVALIVYALQVISWGRFFSWLAIGVLYMIAGLSLCFNPLLASAVLTLLLGSGMFAAGVFRAIVGFSLRSTKGWIWLVVGGVVGSLVGVIVLSGWPDDSLLFIGSILAVDLLFHGLTLVVVAITLCGNGPMSTPSS